MKKSNSKESGKSDEELADKFWGDLEKQDKKDEENDIW